MDKNTSLLWTIPKMACRVAKVNVLSRAGQRLKNKESLSIETLSKSDVEFVEFVEKPSIAIEDFLFHL